MREPPKNLPSEIPELYRVLTHNLYLQPGVSHQLRNEIFLGGLKGTRMYARNQDFRAMVDHLIHYHEWQYEDVSA
jgi:hypothetical protein